MRNYLLLFAFASLCIVFTTFYAQIPAVYPGRYIDGLATPLVKETDSVKAFDARSASEIATSWSVKIIAESFIENNGQFNDRCAATADSSVRFGIDDGGTQTFFKPTGVTYFVVERIRNPNRVKGDMTKAKKVPRGDYVEFAWGGANKAVNIVGSDLASDYFTYCMLKGNNEINPTIENVRGYSRITYESLYPGIDAEYVFHPEGGIKYSLLLQPGANADEVKMVYPTDREMRLNEDGNIVIATMYGDIIEHAPVTYYADAPNQLIKSKFKLESNTVSFLLESYDHSRAIVIDPWVQLPTLPSSNCVWECDRDAAGNVYVIGGDAPMKLLKYNAAGTLQWTYNTPWDATPSAPGESDGDWLGGLATDRNGISYITRGSKAAIQKVSTTGALVWSAAPTNIFTVDEYWTIAFNCDQTKLVVGGTTGTGLDLKGAIFDINTTNGSVTGQRIVGTNRPSIIPGVFNDAMEVRSISSSRNGRYYFITLDSIGSINQNFTPCSTEPLFNDSHGYKFGYKSEEYRPSTGNGPNCAIRANDKFVYTHGGNIVHKRDLASGAIIGSAAIPGGISTVQFGFSQPGNNGIDIDTCGNVYVGSADRVIKYDANLNILTSVNLPFRVFDVAVTTGGEIIVCGGTGTSSTTTRTGYVQVVNMNACPQFTLVCCDATICPAGPICDIASPITLTAATLGGVWSGTGITNTVTGVFSPSVAGAGTHKIVYTLPCGADSIFITVNACANLVVCIEVNGQYTVSNGTGPYTWQRGTPFQNCTGCPLGNCIPFICAGFADTTWTTFSTNSTATPPGTFPIRVTDAAGNRLKLLNATGLLPCTICPNITTTITSQTNISCTQPTGSATVSAAGGTAPYTYNWQPGNLNGAVQTGLGAGAYTVIATDAASCKDTVIVTITSSGSIPSVTVATTATTCGLANGSATANVSGGTAPFTYAWSPGGGGTQTISNRAAGTYTVTVTGTGGCTATASGTIAPSSGFTTAVTTTPSTCTANNGTATATNTGGTSPFTYSWSPSGGSAATASNLAPGPYTVQVNDGNGCTATATGTVTQSSGTLALSLTNPVNPTCAGNNGSITAGLSGGTAPYTVTIDTGGTPIVVNVPFAISQTISNLPDGTVNVTVVDAQGCQVNNSATLVAPNCCTFTVSAALTQPTCGQNNGSIVLTSANGSGNYTYTWANGSGAGTTASGIGAGTYSVTITDNGFANCFKDTTFTLNSNSNLSLSLTNPVNPTCAGNDGSITATLSGGTAPYTVTIDTGGTPIVVNVPFAISQTITNLPDGTVNVSVVDAQGCQVNNSATLVTPNCCTFTVSAALTQPTCAQSNGSIVITSTNGSGNYTYVWANGSGTGTTASNIGAGSYDVTITDNGVTNCFIDTTFTLTSNSSLAISLTNPVNPTCAGNDGSLTVDISGGTAPYTVTIDTGGTPFVINVPVAISQTLTNLPAGIVNVTVVDAQGCQVNNTATLTAPTNCCSFNISAAITQPACGLSDGSIVITPANGSGNYTYTWANGSGTGTTANNLAAGNFAVTITDNGFANCFIDTAFALINANAPAIGLVSQTDVACVGDATGAITVQVSGGTAPYTVLWSNGDTTLAVNGLTDGAYTVSVTDANSCASNATFTIAAGTVLVLQTTMTPIDCNNPNGGSAGVAVTGGTAPYNYLWNNAATTSTLTSVTVGTYTVTVTDAQGCAAVDSVTVTGDSIASFNLGPDLTICFGDSVVLGTGLVGTVWSTGDTSDYLVVTDAGVYSGSISNGNCANSDTVSVSVEQIPNVPQLNVNDTIVCASETVILRVGDEGYLYVWSTGDTASQIVVDTPGIYIVSAINDCGEVSAEALVTDENCACRLYLPNAFSPNADGANDVFKAYTVCTEIEEFNLTIFDRWGGVVYKSNDFTEVWNGTSKGKACIPGVYVYSLSYLSRENGIRQIYRQKGSVTLLR
jgi:gliding motility-associated-like protein